MLSGIDLNIYIEKLAQKINEVVSDTRVVNAFRTVPRHQFVLRGFYKYDHQHRRMQVQSLETMDAEDWLDAVYNDDAL